MNFQGVGHGLHLHAPQLTELHRLELELQVVLTDFKRTHTTRHGHLPSVR